MFKNAEVKQEVTEEPPGSSPALQLTAEERSTLSHAQCDQEKCDAELRKLQEDVLAEGQHATCFAPADVICRHGNVTQQYEPFRVLLVCRRDNVRWLEGQTPSTSQRGPSGQGLHDIPLA